MKSLMIATIALVLLYPTVISPRNGDDGLICGKIVQALGLTGLPVNPFEVCP